MNKMFATGVALLVLTALLIIVIIWVHALGAPLSDDVVGAWTGTLMVTGGTGFSLCMFSDW